MRCVLDNALRCGLLKYQDEWLAIPNTKVLGEFVQYLRSLKGQASRLAPWEIPILHINGNDCARLMKSAETEIQAEWFEKMLGTFTEAITSRPAAPE